MLPRRSSPASRVAASQKALQRPWFPDCPVLFNTPAGIARKVRAAPASKRRMLALALAQCAFTPPPLSGGATASGRRAFLSRAFLGAASAGAATSTLVLSPLPSSAAASPQQVLKSRAIYGSRVFRLQDASAAVIIDEKNVFDLFLTGAQ